MAATALLMAALGCAAAGRYGIDTLARSTAQDKPLLYLPNGRYLKIVSLGHASLAADLVYLWAIQFYSDYARADRYRYVEHVFGNVIGELDPRYADPYWLGALILILEDHDLDGGLRLLDRGFERNPDRWLLPYLAGWECYHAGDYQRAGRYFERASAVPGAPGFVGRMRAGMLARSGDLSQALRSWREIREDRRSDAGARAIAERQIRAIETRLVAMRLQEAVDRFRAATGRSPARLGDLLAAGLVGSLPEDGDGGGYRYDPETGRVSPPEGKVLGEW